MAAAKKKSQTAARTTVQEKTQVTGIVCAHGAVGKCLQCQAEKLKASQHPDKAATKGDIQKPIADLAALVVKASLHADKLRQQGNTVALVKTMDRVKTLIEHIKSVSGEANALYDRIRINMLPSVMEDEGVDSVRVDGIGLCYLSDDIQVSQIDKDAVIAWLTDHHFEDLVKESVNSQTLAAWLRGRLELKDIKEEDRYPKDLITVKPFTRAAIRAK